MTAPSPATDMDGPTVANARLIAELLETLRLFVEQYDNQDLNHVDFRVMVKMRAEEAIAKATGK